MTCLKYDVKKLKACADLFESLPSDDVAGELRKTVEAVALLKAIDTDGYAEVVEKMLLILVAFIMTLRRCRVM